MSYTVTAYDMDHDEVLCRTDTLAEALDCYAEVVGRFIAGNHGYDLDELEDGVTVALEDENENVLAEQDFA